MLHYKLTMLMSPGGMAETIEQMTLRRDREITDARRDLAAQDAELQAEQVKVRAVMRTLGIEPSAEDQTPEPEPPPKADNTPLVQLKTGTQRYGGLSNPQKILTVLREEFPDGATKSQIMDAIQRRWGARINSNTLSVQLSSMVPRRLTNRHQLWHLVVKEANDQ